ncbi:MAG TPA: SDR family NAD(P)-dependent oxidoreductase [Ignavibacteria bacterium]|nr:SDR family NAD(P)-dependent oxidoreductase [Ignavibacteria bacterium]
MEHYKEGSSTFIELLRWRAKNQPDKLAYQFLDNGETEGFSYTYAELDKRARSVAAQLQKIMKKGDRVILVFDNDLEYIAVFYACLYAGIISAPLHPPGRNKSMYRISSVTKDAYAEVILTTSKLKEELKDQFSADIVLKDLNWISTDEMSNDHADEWKDPGIIYSDIAFLQYTSGSTGSPKGVMVTHDNLLYNIYATLYRYSLLELDPKRNDSLVTWAPLFHDLGLIFCTLLPLYGGFPCYMMTPESFIQRPVRWLETISKYGSSISGAPNFAYELLANRVSPEEVKTLDLSTWDIAMNGSEPVRADTLEKFVKHFGPAGFKSHYFSSAWGQAETTIIITTTEKDKAPVIKNFDKASIEKHKVKEIPFEKDNNENGVRLVGHTMNLLDAKSIIVDPKTLVKCKEDQVGEIWVSGTTVTPGYYEKEKVNKETFAAYTSDTNEGPFLRTGDLGFIQGDQLYITGRYKDLIIIRGQNHYPQDIELTVERSHPALRLGCEAAFSVDVDDDEQLIIVQEINKKFIDKDNGKYLFDPDEVCKAIRKAVSEEHSLNVFHILLLHPGTVRKTSSGKIQRNDNRNSYQDGSLSVIAQWREGMPNAEFIKDITEDITNKKILTIPESKDLDLKNWLINKASELLKIRPEDLDMNESFASYGMDSLRAVQLSGYLSMLLKKQIPSAVVYNYPSVNLLLRHLENKTATNENIEKPDIKKANDIANEPIAVIGMACRFPGAENINEFSELLFNGREAIKEFPSDNRWDKDYISDGSTITHGGYLNSIDKFDPQFFGISPREATQMDPQQRLLLEVSWEALEDACIDPNTLKGKNAGVFMGVCSYDYARFSVGEKDLFDVYTGTGTSLSIVSNRLSYLLDLRGPSISVDTACSSSLVAIHQACNSIRSGESSIAIAGGVSLILSSDTNTIFTQTGFLSKDGKCKTFDAGADGYVRGEGCGVVILKSLSKAIEDGDRIHSIIKGSAVNQDGKSNGLTAPNGPSQEDVIKLALSNADAEPADITYIEAHGTGTPLGDPIEVNSIAEVLNKYRSSENILYIGSVKTNIGHLEGAAGIAGVIKTIIALQKKGIPKHLNFNNLNAEILIEGSPVKVVTEKTNWAGNSEGNRLAGVSSFGFGGTNAHVILEEAPETKNTSQKKTRPFNIFTLSAKNENALQKYADKFEKLLNSDSDLTIEDICYSVNTGRAGMNSRLAITASSKADLLEKLKMFSTGEDSFVNNDITSGNTKINYKTKVSFLFPGQGAQYVGMCKELYDTHPLFRNIINQCDEILRNYLEKPLLEVLFYEKDEKLNPINETAYTQPALFAVEYALGKLWMSWGVVPELMMGHSAGEYVAACLAGVFSLEDGLKLSSERGRLMQTLTGDGEMYTIFDNEENVAKAIKEFADPKDVSVASINSPIKTVISGKKDQIAKILLHFDKNNTEYKKINVSIASHSSLMEPMIEEFRKICNEVKYSEALIPIVSNINAEIVTGKMSNADYWCEHIMSSVRFSDSIKECVRSGIDTFIDLGPMPTSIGMAQETIQNPDIKWLASIKKNFTIWETLLQGMGELFVKGYNIDFENFDKEFSHKKISLPSYPFQRQRYWIEDLKKKSIAGKDIFNKKPGSSLLGKKISIAGKNEIIFSSNLSSDDPSFIKEHRIYGKPVFPTTAYAELALEAGNEISGTDKLTIEDLLLHKAFLFEEDTFYNFQIILTETEDKLHKFEIYSSEINDDKNQNSEWTLNASGKIFKRGADIGKIEKTDTEKLRNKFTQKIDTGNFYNETGSCGIEYDGNFKLLNELYIQDNSSFAVIDSNDEIISQFKDYIFHPVLMDACLHTSFAPLLNKMNLEIIYLPIGIESINIYGKAGDKIFSLLEYDPIETAKDILNAKLKVFSEGGDLIAEATGIQMKKVTKQNFLEAQDSYLKDWLYEVVWEKQNINFSDNMTLSADDIKVIKEKIDLSIESKIEENHLSLYKKAIDKVDLLAPDFAAKAFEDLGFEFVKGNRISGQESAVELKITDKHKKLFIRLIEILEEGEIFKRIDEAKDEWEVISIPDTGKIESKTERLKIQGLDAKAEMDLLLRCGSVLADILRGNTDPLQLLFPDGDFGQLTELYERSPAFMTMNSLVKDIAVQIADKLSGDKKLKILEIGAGTGATTSYILKHLKNTEYVFTDVSQLFLNKAKDKFKDFKNTEFGILDIEKDPVTQGYALNDFDIIIASNVIHATRELKQTLSNIKKLLKTEGVLILTEATSKQKWVDLVFGLTDGWWRFEDTEIRSDYSLLNEIRWKELLSDSGFIENEVISVNGKKDISLTSQSVIISKSKRESEKKYLICSDGTNFGELLKKEITSSGNKAILLNSESQFVNYINTDSSINVQDQILFYSDCGRDNTNEFSFDSINYLLTILHSIKGKAKLTIVTKNSQHAISGDSADGYAGSPLFGLGKVIAVEHPELNCKRIDIDSASISNAKLLINETNYTGSDSDGEIAYRDGQRFVTRLKTASSGSDRNISIESESTYLITGGTRGLGLLFAKYLSDKGAKHLALISRSDVPEASVKELEDLKSKGTEVNIYKADISEEIETGNIIEKIYKSGHPLKGIIQSAGLLDDGVISNQTKEKFERVLNPKIKGTLNLSKFTEDRGLDFFIMFSSVASVLGSAGQANHSAANAFLDSFTFYRRAKGLNALTINWGVWSDIGSAANIGADKQEKIPGLKVITPDTGLKLFDRIFRKDFARAGAFGMDWKKFSEKNYSVQLTDFISGLIPAGKPEEEGNRKFDSKKLNILELLKNSEGSDHKEILTKYFQRLISGILGLKNTDLAPDVPLNSIGLDSLMAIELKNRVNIELGVDLNLVKYMESTNILSLADELKNILSEKNAEDPGTKFTRDEFVMEMSEEEKARKLLEDIDNLSEEEIEKLLNNS